MKKFIIGFIICFLYTKSIWSQEYESFENKVPFKASWERYPENAPWTQFLYNLIDSELFDDLDKAKDIVRFCPNYDSVDRDHKIYAWIELFSQVSYYESAWDQTSRMRETTMGTDPITKKPVYSEGLLQLSYQDVANYKRILAYPKCKINWEKDKNRNPKSIYKTILDANINLECGSRILADQVRRTGSIVLSRNVYWSTLKENGKYSVVPAIEKNMSKVSFCKR